MGLMAFTARCVSCIGQPLKPERWRNIVVLKRGRSISGVRLHPSRETARAAADRAEIHWSALASMGVQVIELDAGSFLFADYSHCEQAKAGSIYPSRG